MNFRIACIADADQIARVGIICADHQKDGFMHLMGFFFMREYYKSFIKEKNSVIIVAEENSKIIGFHSGTLMSEEHQRSIAKRKLRFAFASLPAVLKNPGLLIEIYRRFNSLKSVDLSYRVSNGPRAEYWAWLPSIKNPAASVILRRTWTNVLRDLGCESFKFEVDLANKDINRYAKAFNCNILEIIELPDGRKRAVLEQVIQTK